MRDYGGPFGLRGPGMTTVFVGRRISGVESIFAAGSLNEKDAMTWKGEDDSLFCRSTTRVLEH